MPADLYLIALVPPLAVREQVRALKLEMRRRFGAGHALKSPAHITLQMPFRLALGGLEKFEETLRKLAVSQHPFTIKLDGFDCFAPRVIFIRVKEHRPVTALERQLKSALSEKDLLPPQKRAMPFHPHMTIATRDLEEAAFATAWREFKNRPFQMVFEVSGLFLLRHNGSRWELFREFEFGNPVSGHSAAW